MKKMIALVLALVMTLSLLPMTVWAEGTTDKLWWMRNGTWKDTAIEWDRGMPCDIRLGVGPNADSVTELTDENCTVVWDGSTETLPWNTDGSCFVLDTSVATKEDNTITATVGGVSYTLPLKIYFLRLYIATGNETYDSRVTVGSETVYNWTLYREMAGTRVQITEADFTIFAEPSSYNDKFSWNTDGSVKFDANGLTADKYPIKLIAKATDGHYFHFTINGPNAGNQPDADENQGEAANGSTTFTPRGISIFTKLENNTLSYSGTFSEASGVVTVPCGEGGITIFLATGDSLAKTNSPNASWPESVTFGKRENNPTRWAAGGNRYFYIYEMTVAGQENGKVEATLGGLGQLGDGTLTFCFDFDPQQGGGPEGMPHSGIVATGTDVLDASEISGDLDTWDYIGITKIDTIEGVDYYFGLVRHESNGLLPMKWDGDGLSQGAQVNKETAIGFWKRVGTVTKILEGEELAAILENFTEGDIAIKLYASGGQNAANIEYPWSESLEDGESAIAPYPCARRYVFNHYSQGKWLLIASGKYKGEPVVARAFTNQTEQQVHVIDVGDVTVYDTVGEINDAISAGIAACKSADFEGRIAIELPAIPLNGYIEVKTSDYEVMLNGQMAGGELKTVLNGGVIAECDSFYASRIRFIGAGKTNSTSGYTRVVDSETQAIGNYAISGTSCGGFFDCTFTGYDCAVYITHGLTGGTTNFFYDNNVGIRVADPDGLIVGNHQIYDTVFAYNEKDIEVLDADGVSGNTKHYAIWDTIFIGSKKNISVAESVWDVLYIPKNAFDDGTDADDEPIVEGRVSATPFYGLSPDGKDALYGLLGASGRNAAYYLGHPQFNKAWIDSGMRFNAEWMCPESPDSDVYTVPGDEIRRHHDRGHNMTIKVMGDRNGCDEHVATIKLKKAN